MRRSRRRALRAWTAATEGSPDSSLESWGVQCCRQRLVGVLRAGTCTNSHDATGASPVTSPTKSTDGWGDWLSC